MADEVKIAFGLPGPPDAAIRAWKAEPPAFLDRYELDDESYDTLVYKAHVMGLGMKILMFGFADRIYTLTVTFVDGEGDTTRVTLNGQATADVRDRVGAYLRAHTEAL